MALKNLAVRRFRSPAAMASFAAGLLKAALRRKKGKLTVALSGGKTPAALFNKLASLSLPWERVIFFMADERLVPFSSPHSNFGAARRALFNRIPVPPENLRPPQQETLLFFAIAMMSLMTALEVGDAPAP